MTKGEAAGKKIRNASVMGSVGKSRGIGRARQDYIRREYVDWQGVACKGKRQNPRNAAMKGSVGRSRGRGCTRRDYIRRENIDRQGVERVGKVGCTVGRRVDRAAEGGSRMRG